MDSQQGRLVHVNVPDHSCGNPFSSRYTIYLYVRVVWLKCIELSFQPAHVYADTVTDTYTDTPTNEM